LVRVETGFRLSPTLLNEVRRVRRPRQWSQLIARARAFGTQGGG